MNSIRATLVVMLVAAFSLISFLAALNGYRASMEEAERLLDKQLHYASNVLLAAAIPDLPKVAEIDGEVVVVLVQQELVELALRCDGQNGAGGVEGSHPELHREVVEADKRFRR